MDKVVDGKISDDNGEDPATGDENIRHHALYDLPTDEEDIAEDGSEDLSSEADEEMLGEDQRGPTYSPSAGQDIYGRFKGVAEKAYVPPHLRHGQMGRNAAESSAAVPGSSYRDLVRLLNGQLNRLSENSLDPVLFEIGRLYDDHSTSVVNHELFSAMKTVCVHPTQTMSTLIPCYAALIAGLHVTRGAEVGGRALETIGQELSASLGDQIPNNKRALNLALILGYLYVLGVAHHELIFDILHMLSERGEMSDLEILPPLLQLCSNRLRKDDATTFREELAHVRSNAENKISVSAAAEEENPAGTELRAKLLMEACVECKSKKARKATLGTQERILSLRKWLGKVRSSNSGAVVVPLRISWEDLTCAKLRGRWWLVGAAWSGGGGECVTSTSQDGDNGTSAVKRCHPEQNDEEMAVKEGSTIQNKLSSLAATLSMNTGTRKQVFYALMSSADFEDAADSILRLNLRNKLQREVARVILICCCKESTYNPFYAYVGAKLCEQQVGAIGENCLFGITIYVVIVSHE